MRNRLRNIIINYFVPDYYSIKSKNKELKQDIYNIIRKENQAEGIQSKMFWNMNFDIEDMLWMGDATNTKPKGIFNNIK